MNSLLGAAAALTTTVLISSGCASTDPTTTTDAPRGELVYRTGSNIPVRDKAPMTKEEQERRTAESQRAAQQMQTTGAGNPRTN